MVLFILLYRVVIVGFKSVDGILKRNNSWSNESYEQNFPLMLFIMLNKVVLTFESVDEILNCDHSTVVSAVCSCCAVCITISFKTKFLNFV